MGGSDIFTFVFCICHPCEWQPKGRKVGVFLTRKQRLICGRLTGASDVLLNTVEYILARTLFIVEWTVKDGTVCIGIP